MEEEAYSHCPACRQPLQEGAAFCGKCGQRINRASSLAQVQAIRAEQVAAGTQSTWQWVMPAIRLWVLGLVIYGILALFAQHYDLSSPWYDAGIQLIYGLVIIAHCWPHRARLLPLFRWGYKGLQNLELIAAFALMYVFMWGYFHLLTSMGVENYTYLDDFMSHGWPLAGAFVVICVMPAFFEELAYRGYILYKLERMGSLREAMVIQAAMFSVSHLLPGIFISHFIMGLVFGYIRLRSKSLLPAMVLHACWNAVVLTEEYLGW